MNSIPLISNVPGVNFSMNRGNTSPEVQMRQEINTSLVALKKEAGTLEGLISEALQILDEVNNRIATLENDTVKKNDVVNVVQSGNMNPVTSNAVADKINSLDVSSVGGNGKYISAISETDGKINATATDLATSVASGNTNPVTGNAVFNYVNRLDVKVPRPTLQYSKVTVALNASEPYITTLVALMTRGCGLCLVGLCGQDSGTKPNIIKYLSNSGQYSSYFYYRDINNVNKIEFYWTGSAYSTRDSIAILTNAQNVTIEEVSYVSTLPSDVVVL